MGPESSVCLCVCVGILGEDRAPVKLDGTSELCVGREGGDRVPVKLVGPESSVCTGTLGIFEGGGANSPDGRAKNSQI